MSSGVSNHDTNFWSIFQRYQIQNSCLIPQKWKILLPKFRKNAKKMPFSQKNWPKSLIKVWKFGSTIHTYSKEKSTIRNRIHYIKFILVLVIWKNPLIRVFPLFAIKLYRESTVLSLLYSRVRPILEKSFVSVSYMEIRRTGWCWLAETAASMGISQHGVFPHRKRSQTIFLILVWL